MTIHPAPVESPAPSGGAVRSAAARTPRPWVPEAAAWACALIGLLDLLSALTKAQAARLHQLRQYVPGGLSHVSTAATLVVGLLLVLLARGLRRRKRRAYRLTVGLIAASIALHILKGLDVEEATVSLILLVGLLVVRNEFYARADPRTRWRAFGVGVLMLSISFLLGVCFIALRQDRLVGAFSLQQTSQHVLDGLFGVNGPLQFTPDRRGRATADLVADALLALGASSGAIFLYLLLRPGTPIPRLTSEDESRMRALLARHGRRDSLSYFALRRDKSVVWSPSEKACVAYRVVSGVILASGDPLGDPEAWPGAITAFLDLADTHAWTPGVMGCSELAGTAWSRAGLTALEMGDEAIVEVGDFSLQGRPMRNVRQAAAKVERAGYRTTVSRVADLTEEAKAELRRQADEWRGTETERGFSMALGRFADPSDPDCVVVMAHQAGALKAFLHFVPWGSDGLSLDLMRRDREAESGVNELLIVKALEAGPEVGIARFSLNFAVFRSALERGERLGAGPVIRGWRRLLIFASRWFQIESLYRFNAKFRPIWEPRFLCFASARDLPRVAFAALQAEAFLVLPRPRLTRRRPPAQSEH